jgi:Ti-type conjugative transfer relaxase TraA
MKNRGTRYGYNSIEFTHTQYANSKMSLRLNVFSFILYRSEKDMAIQFARCQYVSRSTGGNACRKASYNQRETVTCERTGQIFSFKERGGNAYHEILLPTSVSEKFKNSEVLWNAAENAENRKNSQVAKEFVIALPDDKQITLEDRVELTRRFAREHFIEKGVAVQLDLHEPHEDEKNWHAHLLVTTRRFSIDGETLDKKARDLDPVLRNGLVLEADIWGEHWRDLQNAYFIEKGYDLQVDPIGIVPQEHLGPVRMRHHMNEAIQRAALLEKANEELSKNPEHVLDEITHHKAVFNKQDVEAFLKKHVPLNEREGLSDKIMSESNVLSLYDRETGEETGYFTTREVRAEEEKLLRFAYKIAAKETFSLPFVFIDKGLKNKTLSEEQRKAYDLCTSSGQNLSIIQGRAGVGKSYVLEAIRVAHEESSFRVIGLAPTHKVANDLKINGFKESKTCHSFLFAFKNNRETLNNNTLVIVDEAAMLGTELTVELLNVVKSTGAKLVLVGDDHQLKSVERGGAFRFLSERYDAAELTQVRRQNITWQKSLSEEFSKGEVKKSLQLLKHNNGINWRNTKEESLFQLLMDWGKNTHEKSSKNSLILAHKNIDVDALNQGARDILRSQGKLGDLEISCMTQRGKMTFGVGDRIQLTKTDRERGISNGTFGFITHIDPQTKKLTLLLDNKETKEINPEVYDGLRHGYASTVFKAQGSTLDHVYVLHSSSTNQSVSYVALTRQKATLSLYVSKNETPTHAHLIQQMSRGENIGTSLYFNTSKDILRRKEEKSFLTHLKENAEDLTIKIKDVFHRNEEFYTVPKTASLTKEKSSIVSPIFPVQGKSFSELFELCERRLYYVFKTDNKRDPNSNEIKELNPQVKRTAEIVFHQYAQKGIDPSQNEIALISKRAGYEEMRIPIIRAELMEKGNTGSESEALKAHMLAERIASIEGRMIFEAKQKGKKTPCQLYEAAKSELNSHIDQTKELAQEMTQKHPMSYRASLLCANNILRYKETNGEAPSETQTDKMATIAIKLDKDNEGLANKKLDSGQLNLQQRRLSDLLFIYSAENGRFPIKTELKNIEEQTKISTKEMSLQVKQEISMLNQKELSL